MDDDRRIDRRSTRYLTFDAALEAIDRDGDAVFSFKGIDFWADRDCVNCSYAIGDGLTFTVRAAWPDRLSSEEGRHAVVRLLESMACRCKVFNVAEANFVAYCRRNGMATR